MFFPLKIKLFFFLCLLFVPTPAFSGTGSSVDIETGRRVYKNYCKVCHGDNGDGKTFLRNALKTPPADFTAAGAAERLSFKRMKRSVLFGRSGTAMIAWKDELSSDEIDSVLRFIRVHFMGIDIGKKEAVEKSYEEVAQKYKGSVSKGRELYQKHCYHCHGVKGDSRMPVNGGLRSPPRDFTDPLVKETLLEAQMFYSIREGINQTAMVSWKKEFSDKDTIDIISYIKRGLMAQKESPQGY